MLTLTRYLSNITFESTRLEKRQIRSRACLTDMPSLCKIKKQQQQKTKELSNSFDMLFSHLNIGKEEFFQMVDTSTRGHSKKIFKLKSNKSIRYNSFAVRIVEGGNILPKYIISSTSLLQFKTKLDRHWITKRFDDREIYVNSLKANITEYFATKSYSKSTQF